MSSKIIEWSQLPEWRARVRGDGKRLVVTNGCFDILHRGHVSYLAAARAKGDLLLVGLNSDASVRELKGPDRPLNTEEDRACVLAALESVSALCIFPDKSAAPFLAAAKPDVYVKGGDYTLDTLDQEERRLVERNGGEIVILPLVPGRSTTALLRKLRG